MKFEIKVLNLVKLFRIHDILKNLYSKSEPQEMDWEKEMFCAANNTGVWERGQVCSMSSSSVAEVDVHTLLLNKGLFTPRTITV